VKLNIIYQDNTSSMRLEQNGKESSGKSTHHFDIKYFYVTDLVGRKEVTVEYCPTDEMIADYMTKPLVGSKFKLFRDRIMNLSGKHHRIAQQECVGGNNNGKNVKGVKLIKRQNDVIAPTYRQKPKRSRVTNE
jgi:hypothetical protein